MKSTIYLFGFILSLLSLTFISCGGGKNDTGSASFGLRFEQTSAPSEIKPAPSAASAVDICASYGIDSISGTVYNSSNTVIATGGPWACSVHQGTITNIPAGSNLKIEIQGTVASSVVWQGETTGVTVTADHDTDVGTVTMTYIGSDTTPPTVSSFTPSGSDVPVTTVITATFSENISEPTINTDTFTLYDNSAEGYVNGDVTYDSSTKTATFIPSGNLSYSSNYTAEIMQGATGVQDLVGWMLQGTSKWNFITEAFVVVHVPDTGQTGGYTATFGEDSDYTINSPSYTDNGNGTITDNVTGFQWQKQDDATARTWTDAGTYCTNLSLAGTGWRLPTDFELMTIVDYGIYNPSINTTYFPNTQSSYYWSSTATAGSTLGAWKMDLYYGNSSYDDKANSFYVRCVRGGQ